MNKKIVRWHYLALAVVGMLFAGTVYAWSILKAPLGAEFGWSSSQLAVNYTCTMCCFGFGAISSGFLSRRVSPRLPFLIAAVTAGGGFVITSFQTGILPLLYISYGCMGGFGIGMAYNTAVATTTAWYPDRKGFCSGCTMMGFGASSMVLGNIAGKMLDSPVFGWRKTYLILGVLTITVLLAAAVILRLPTPEEAALLPAPKQKAAGPSSDDFEPRDYTTSEMLRRSSFWRFLLFALTLCAMGNTVISFTKDVSMSVGASASLATSMVGILSLCNGLSRILFGIIFDNFGRKVTMRLSSALAISALTITLIAITIHSVPVCILGLALTGFAYGSSPTTSSTFVSSFYGTKYFSMNLSIINSITGFSSLVVTPITMLVESTGGYVAPYLILIGLAIIGLILNLSIKRP